MGTSIKRISEGSPFTVEFKKVMVERCHYINATEERIEKMSLFSSASALMVRAFEDDTIFVQIIKDGQEFPFVHFRVNTAFYHKDERAESSQTALVRGTEIVEEFPINIKELEHGKIGLFNISIQRGMVIAHLLLNLPDNNDYYYRLTFLEK